MHTKLNKLSMVICLFFTFFTCGWPTVSWGLRGADIGLYNDTSFNNGGAWELGLIEIKKMLTAYGYSYEQIGPLEINNTKNLNALYKVILYGGGWAEGYNTYTTQSGYKNIRNFVKNGGGYFGICAGSYFASDIVFWKEDYEAMPGIYNDEYPLNLFKGVGKGPVLDIKEWTSPTGCETIPEGAAMTTVDINNSVFPNVAPKLEILYYGGPLFIPFANEWEKITTIATYNVPDSPADGKPAMIIFPYGNGQVFLTGPHPELYYDFDQCTITAQNQIIWKLMHNALSLLM